MRPRWGVLLPCAALVLILLALGTWQVQRLAWKTDLIARTEAALAAPPVPATEGFGTEYQRVTVTGQYLPGPGTLVQAVTQHGGGSWVMAGFQTQDGWHLLVNRGFLPDNTAPPAPPEGPVTLSGLMRETQPGGGFLRANDPEANRWFSRDTQAIGERMGQSPVAPWFLDLDRDPANPLPMGGLTVVQFPNSHLSYALTWFAMAAGLAWLLWRTGLRPAP